MKIYLVEINGYNPVSLSEETLRFCTGIGFITKPTETPANTTYLPRIGQAGSITANMFANGATSGVSNVGFGEITLRNIDGAFDYLADWGFDGRTVTVRRGEDTGNYPADFPIFYTATIQQPVPEYSLFVFRLRDKQYILDKPIQTLKFAGTGGIEGNATDIKNKNKPIVIGKVWNIAPIFCGDNLKLIYALNIRVDGGFDSITDVDALTDSDAATGATPLNTGVSISAMYDSGASLTAGAVYSTEEEMNTQVPAGGTYRVWPAGGYVRLGLAPTGALTADCLDLGSTATTPTVANLIKNLLIQEAAVPLTDISQTDLTVLNAANSSAVGDYIIDDTKFPAVFDKFCASVGAWYGFDRLGIFRIKQITLPLSNPVLYITASSSYERLSVADTTNGIPARRLVMQWRKNYTVIKGTEVVGVPEDRKAQIALEYRETEVKDVSVAVPHLLADVVNVASAFYDDPTAEAQRQFNIYKSRRDRFRVKISLNVDGSEQLLTLGTVINVALPRFNLSNGKNLMVIGYTLDCANNWVDTILWG